MWHTVVVGVLVAVLYAVAVGVFAVAQSLDESRVPVVDLAVCALDTGCK